MSPLYSHCLHLFAFGDAIFSVPGSILFALVFFFPDWRGHFLLVCWKLNNLSPTPVYYFWFWFFFFLFNFKGLVTRDRLNQQSVSTFSFRRRYICPSPPLRGENKTKREKNQFNPIWTGLCVCVCCCRLLGNPTVADKFAQSRRINPRHSWPYSNILLRWLCSSIPCLVELITHSLKLFLGREKDYSRSGIGLPPKVRFAL